MRTAFWIVVVLLAAQAAQCQVGTNGIDARFGTTGVVTFGATSSGLEFSRIYALTIQPDGKILIAGRGNDPASPGSVLPAIGRLNSNGSWDISFANNGIFILPAGSAAAPQGGVLDNVRLFSNGNILVSGGVYAPTTFNYEGCTLLIKLTDTGALDTTFAPDHSGAFCFAFALPRNDTYYVHVDGIAIDSDDTFYLTSSETNRNSGAVAHFDQTGTLIPSFGFFGIAPVPRVYANTIQLLPNHEPLVAGVYIPSLGAPQSAGSSHLDLAGNIDGSYGVNGIFANTLTAPAVGLVGTAMDAQHRLLIADNDLNGTTESYRFIRVTDTGQLDSSFNNNAQQPGYPGFAQPIVSGDSNADWLVAAQPLADGHIFAVGNAGPLALTDGATNLALLRLNEDASWDTGFGNAAHPGWASLNIGGTSTTVNYARAIATDSTGKILIAVSIANDINGNACQALVRIVPDRIFDAGMDPAIGFPSCPN